MTTILNHDKNSPPDAAAVFLFAVLGGGMAAAVVGSFLPPEISRAITREGGVVESASALLWLAAAGLLAMAAADPSAAADPVGRMRRLALAVLPLAAGLREFDLHKKLTTDSILKSNYWLGKIDVPLGEKIIAAAVLLLILFCAAVAIKHSWKKIIADLRARRPLAWQIFSALVLLAVAKVLLDGINSNLSEWFNYAFPPAVAKVAPTWEEWAELSAALLVCGAVFFTRRRKAQTGG